MFVRVGVLVYGAVVGRRLLSTISVRRRASSTTSTMEVSHGLIPGECCLLVLVKGAFRPLSHNFMDEVVVDVTLEPITEHIVVNWRGIPSSDSPVGCLSEVFGCRHSVLLGVLEGGLGLDNLLGAVAVEGEDEFGDEVSVVVLGKTRNPFDGFGVVFSRDVVDVDVEIVVRVGVIEARGVSVLPGDGGAFAKGRENGVATTVVTREVLLVGSEVRELGGPVFAPVGTVEVNGFGDELVLLDVRERVDVGQMGVSVGGGRGSAIIIVSATSSFWPVVWSG